MSQLLLTASIVLLTASTTSAFSIDWGAFQEHKQDFVKRIQSWHDSKNGDSKNDDDNHYDDEKDYTQCEEWYEGDHDFFGHRWSDKYDWYPSHGDDAQQHVDEKLADWKEHFESKHEENDNHHETDKYEKVMEGLEWIIGKHEGYVEHKQEKIERLCEWIERLQEKLGECQEDGDNGDNDHEYEIPEKYQPWIDKWHEKKEHFLTKAIEWLGEKKSRLEEKIEWHESIQEKLSDVLDGKHGTGDAPKLLAGELAIFNTVSPTISTATTSAVPEPTTSLLAALALLSFALRRRP
jgi:hypothetical protein